MSLKISVISPSFNQAQFLPDNLKSVAGQTYPDVEHIVVDPGSTDGSRAIAAAQDGVILIAERDKGQSDGITKGFERATGDILVWLNSDDFYPSPDVLAKVAKAFEENPEADIVYGNVDFVDEDGNFLRKGYVNPKGDQLLQSFPYQVGIVQPGVFWRKSVFEKLGGPSDQYEYCMDYEYWVRMAAAGLKWVHIDEKLAHHRWWAGMKTSSGRDQSLVEHMRVCHKYFGYIHWKWLDRYAEFLTSREDGVVNHAVDIDQAEKSRIANKVAARYVTQDMLRHLKASDDPEATATLDYLNRLTVPPEQHMWSAGELEGLTETSSDPDAEKRRAWRIMDARDAHGHEYKSYLVPDNFHRVFDAEWLNRQLARSKSDLETLSASRKDICVIVGNGPSLKETNLELLRDADADVIISNFATLNRDLYDLATFLTVTNNLVAEQGCVDFNSLDKRKVVPFWLANSFNATDETSFVSATVEPRFCRSLSDTFSWRSTVSYFNMQLAFALGYKKVLLVGFDHSYVQPDAVKEGDLIDQKDDDQNHFDSRYFKGMTWQAADTGNMEAVYRLAKGAYEEAGREIINCTVGGKLEVFRRGKLEIELAVERPETVQSGTRTQASTAERSKISALNGSHSKRYPRVLLIDMTPIGDASATGQVKSELFADWPSDNMYQLFADGGNRVGSLHGSQATIHENPLGGDANAILKAVEAYNPDLILYRPTPRTFALHRTAMKLVKTLNKPLVTWIMDDWPEALRREDPEELRRLNVDWEYLLKRSVTRLSISRDMSQAFADRYDLPFHAVANAIDPGEWLPAKPAKDGQPVKIRYAGSLAENMTRSSIQLIAEAVEQLAQAGLDVSFEIKTRTMWKEQAGKLFERFKHTKIIADELSREEYMQWLSSADVTVIAYNFDQASRSYIQYSLANKLPECLASGSALFAVGPAEIATIRVIKRLNCGSVVSEDNLSAVAEKLGELARQPKLRHAQALVGQQVAAEHFNIKTARSELFEILSNAALPKSKRDPIIRELARADAASVDETAVVAELLSHRRGRKHVMLDVGAHFGTSARYFNDLGWTIHCFEPDPSNRSKLFSAFGNAPNITIDPRAVSDQPQQGVNFFTSTESTGISGLLSFRESHVASNLVDVTTIEDIVEEKGLPNKVDFLKIDVEGYDLAVLRGVPWNTFTPEVIECEFEDAKTLKLGHNWRDIADYLTERGYAVYVSEWHPIVRYGIAHDWRRVTPYPGYEIGKNAWGNLLAFRDDPGYEAVAAAFTKLAKLRGTKSANGASAAPAKKPAAVSKPAPKPRVKYQSEKPMLHDPKKAANIAKAIEPASLAKTQAPIPVAQPATPHRGRLGSIGKFVSTAANHIWMRRMWTLPVILLALVGVGLTFLPALQSMSGVLRVASLIGVLLAFTGYVAFRAYVQITALRLELNAIKQSANIPLPVMRQQRESLNAMRRELEAVSNRIDEEGADQKLRMHRRLNELRLQTTAAQSELKAELLKSMKDRMAFVRKEFGRIELDGREALDELSSQLTTFEKSLSNFEESLVRLSKRTAAAESNFAETQSGLGTLDKQIVEVQGQVERNLEVSRQQRLAVDRHIDQAVAELRDQLSELNVKIAHNLEVSRQQRAALDASIDSAASALREDTEKVQKRIGQLDKWAAFDNSKWFQHFNRRINPDHIQTFETEWPKRLSLPISKSKVGYMASRVCEMESKLDGRLATSVEDAVLRSLVARAIKGDRAEILEIGTLFGTGAAIVFDAIANHFEKVHFTLLDPLEGYYNASQADILTGQPVNERTLRRNLARAGMTEDNFTLVKKLSTDPEAIEETGQRKYDLMIIDGDHSYAGVKTDFENYMHMVKLGGYIIFDDYSSPDWPEVQQYVDDELADNQFVSRVGASWRTCVYRVVKSADRARSKPVSRSRASSSSSTSTKSKAGS